MGTCLSTLHSLAAPFNCKGTPVSSEPTQDFGLHRMFDHGKGGTVKPPVSSQMMGGFLHRKDSAVESDETTGRIECQLHLDTKSPEGISPLSVKHVLIFKKSRVSSSRHVVARDVTTHARAHQRPESMRQAGKTHYRVEICLQPHQPPQTIM